MLNVPESIKRLYQTDGINKNFRVHFPNGENADLTNKDIVEGSVKFDESVSSKDVLKFGLSEQSKIEFECVGVQNIFGMTIECSNEIDISSLTAEDIQTIQEGEWDGTLVLSADSDIDYGYFRIPLGTFVVSSCPRSHGAMAHRRVVGYSNLFGDEYEQYRTLFDGTFPYKQLTVDLYLIQYLMGEKEMTQITNELTTKSYTASGSSVHHAWFYDSNGNTINITFSHTTQETNWSRGITGGDFLAIESEGDYDKYRRNGEAILSAIVSSGVDIRYDATKKRIYPTVEAAVRAQMPYIFSPVLFNTQCLSKEASISGYVSNSIPLHDGLVPIFATYNYSNADRGFNGVDFSVPSGGIRYPFNILSVSSAGGGIIHIGGQTIEYDKVDYDFQILSATSLQIPTGNRTNTNIVLNPALTTNFYYYYKSNVTSGSTIASSTHKNYVYQNSISVPEFIKSFLELNAEFGRVGRTGSEITSLSKQNPINIEPSDVEELWWDEYDVEQIGTVRYNIADTQAIVEYQVGNGGSVYDFGNNYFIKRIFASYTEDNYIDAINLINSLIDQYFVPNVTDVPFIPVDMTMRGLPYVESGDYIVYDDGIDQVGTYVLNREMDGVQTLFDDIESNGGEVMGK